jgi:hypothetical protein
MVGLKLNLTAHYKISVDNIARQSAPCPLLADFVAEVGDDKSVAAGANFLS